MATEITTYTCDYCKAKYPGRKENTFAGRAQVRKHLREEHETKHNNTRHHSDKSYTCHCLMNQITINKVTLA